MEILSRLLEIELPANRSAFLWGPRKVGKSYWLQHHFPDDILIDFLKTDVYAEYISRPSLLRERFSDTSRRIIIDEIQMVPALLNEIHWLMTHRNCSFLLTGSSPRKLKRGHANLLGGRAWRYTMAPLCSPEIKDLDIEKIMVTGLLPPHLLSPDPTQELRAYVADYFKEEIIAEAMVQNIPAFSEFLRIAALTSSEMLNYTHIARETGVSAKVIRNYFQILEDTLLGFRLSPWRKTQNRRLIKTEKFYLFDVGLSNYLARRQPNMGTPEFGKSFEHFILLELMAYRAYRNPELPIHFWRTVSGQEVDFIVGDMALAVEVKSARRVHKADLKGLQQLRQEQTVKKSLLVSFETESKQLEGIECLHWQHFLKQLWQDELPIT